MSTLSWNEYFMNIAADVAVRGTCNRAKIGALIVQDTRIIATGYNGAPTGWDSCDKIGHLMSKINDQESCVRAIHAEENAILQCARHAVSPVGAAIYITASPCFDCFKRLAQVGISKVYYNTIYAGGRTHGIDIAKLASQYNIEFNRVDLSQAIDVQGVK